MAGYRTRWRDEFLLLFPLIAFTYFISSQRGFNRHLRYILPVFPFAFILMCRVARNVSRREWGLVSAMLTLTGWGIVSSLLVYPHSLGYFNEYAGGPKNGHRHLLGSNTDWGQDLLYLKSWVGLHPEVKPLYLKLNTNWYDETVARNIAGLASQDIPTTPTPGWHAISVNIIHEFDGTYAYYIEAVPVATAGHSIFIYHLTEKDCELIKSKVAEPPSSHEVH